MNSVQFHATIPEQSRATSWHFHIRDALWKQRMERPLIQHQFSLAAPILARTLANAYAACRGNRHSFALLIRRMGVVEKTKAFFMVRAYVLVGANTKHNKTRRTIQQYSTSCTPTGRPSFANLKRCFRSSLVFGPNIFRRTRK